MHWLHYWHCRLCVHLTFGPFVWQNDNLWRLQWSEDTVWGHLSSVACENPSEFSHSKRYILDQIFSDIDTTLQSVQSLPTIGSSDHNSIFWLSRSKAPSCVKKQVRKFPPSNRARFTETIYAIDWLSLVESAVTLDDGALVLQRTIFHLYDKCFPFRTVRYRFCDPPWMQACLKLVINERDRAWTNGKMEKYTRLRRKAIFLTKKLKANYLRTAVTSNKAEIFGKQFEQLVSTTNLTANLRK